MKARETTEGKLKKGDRILIAAILVAALLCCCGIWIFQRLSTREAVARVTIDGIEYNCYPLHKPCTERIELADGAYNVLEIRDGEADIIKASCPDKVCVNHRAVSKNGETIVCLPNKLVIEIVNGEDSGVDAATN